MSSEERESIDNGITGGVFFHAVIQGRDISVHLPAPVPTALAGLPAASNCFTGRNDELAMLVGLLDPTDSVPVSAVSAVSGLPGVGQTELALQAAHNGLTQGWFPGGVLFIDLHGYDDARRIEPGVALERWLRTLGIPGEHIPPAEHDRARLDAAALSAGSGVQRRNETRNETVLLIGSDHCLHE